MSKQFKKKTTFTLVPLEEISETITGETLGSEQRDELFGILGRIIHSRMKLYKRLKEEPLGFPVTDGYSCDVCGVLLNISTGWHSQYGITCIYCRNAYQNGVLPLYISKHPNSFFNLAQLHHTFGITRQHIFKYIKEYVLFPVLITKEDGSIYTYIFLKKDNLGLYDPVCPISKSIMRYNKKIMTQWTYKRIQKIKAQ